MTRERCKDILSRIVESTPKTADDIEKAMNDVRKEGAATVSPSRRGKVSTGGPYRPA
jgi:hypothetical protein